MDTVNGKTKTTEEAMAVLKKYRADHIARARAIADELIARDGKTSSKRVYNEMKSRELIDHTISDHWLGAVFNNAKYAWTGEWTTSNVGPNTHSPRANKVWRRAA
jgi:hypothetical protein